MKRRPSPSSKRVPLLLVRVEPEFVAALDRLAARLYLKRGRAEMARDLLRHGLVVLLEEAERKDLAEITKRALAAARSPSRQKGGRR
jgi:hypothetical protein